MTLEQAKRRLGRLLQGMLRGIEVAQRGVSPRIVSAELVGSAGTTTVSGPELEAALGLPSAWACFDVTGPSGTPPRGWDSACTPPPGAPTQGPTGASGAT
jgi:stage II sporulation protein D